MLRSLGKRRASQMAAVEPQARVWVDVWKHKAVSDSCAEDPLCMATDYETNGHREHDAKACDEILKLACLGMVS